jgi:rhodanese-related sulfurtransferase
MQPSSRIDGPTSTTEPTPATQLVAHARAVIEGLTVDELAHELEQQQIVLVDLREQAEREAHGTIPGGLHIPRGMLEFCADPALPVHADELDPSRRIVLYCALGSRSALAAQTLDAIGFPDVAHLEGGFDAWQRTGRTTQAPSATDGACWAHLLQG